LIYPGENQIMTTPRSDAGILIVYYSRFGVLRALAECIAQGAREVEGLTVDLLEVDDRPVGDPRPGENEHDPSRRRAETLSRLVSADALVVGAPAYFGSMAAAVKRLFEDCVTASLPLEVDPSRPWRHTLFRGKVGAGFTASATPHGGNEHAIHTILTMMMHLGMIVVTPGQRPPILEDQGSPYGATAVSGPDGDRQPDTNEQRAARALGRQVAEVATWIRWGRREWERQELEAQRALTTQPGAFDPSA
jgi:NAD(P)H dehydrogenase (quinone)